MNRRLFLSFIATVSTVMGTLTKSLANSDASINSVPYPYGVIDEASLKEWLFSTRREQLDWSKVSEEPSHIDGAEHQEVKFTAPYLAGDTASFNTARSVAFQSAALSMFWRLANAPKGKIVWRIRPELNASWSPAIPSDLSKIETRQEAESRVFGNKIPGVPLSLASLRPPHGDWGIDYAHDVIVPLAAPIGTWNLLALYMRYSVIVDGRSVAPPQHSPESNSMSWL